MAGYTLYATYTKRFKTSRWLTLPVFISLVPVASLFTVAPYLLTLENRDVLAPLLSKDIFATKLILSGDIWGGWEGIPSLIFLCFVLIWVFQFALGIVKHAIPLFFAVLLFSQYLYTIVLPKAEKMIQGAVIQTIKQESTENNTVVESWNYKTFAILYYGNTQPHQFRGIWSKTAKQEYKDEAAPNYTARKNWIVKNAVNFPVSIITRCDFKPDSAFLESFSKKQTSGAYDIWRKINP
jgi:hypothetical protein